MDALIKNADTIGAVVGFVLTLLVFSYIFGDNFLFRLTTHVFIGVAAGYAAVLVVYNVILPQKFSLQQDELVRWLPPLIFGLLMLTKLSPRFSRFGNPVLAYLVGAGAAAAIGGAIFGTLFPQVDASTKLFENIPGNIWNWIFNLVIIIGTVTTLIYFHFSVRSTPSGTSKRFKFIEILSWVGQIFIAVTLGALFAGVLVATLSAFVERMYFLWNFVWDTLIPLFS
jgi:hypothetical protein